MTAPAQPKLSVSIAMCTYNGSRFLPEQLAGIAKQIRLPDEMVICDDGSSDATPEIVEDFSRSVSFPVRFVRNEENLGSTKNFEKAIALCTGDLIALSDQDDIWLPEKLVRQAEILERSPEIGGVFSDAELVDDQSKSIGATLWARFLFTPQKQKMFSSGKAPTVLLERNVVTGATLMFRSDLRALFLPIPKIWYHDGWMAWMMALYSRLAFIPEPLMQYRRHTDQQVGAGVLGKLPLRKKLDQRKRGMAAKQLSDARELSELERRIAAMDRPTDQSIAQQLRKKIEFVTARGTPYRNRLSRIVWILRNAGNYHRYDDGWKCLLWDIAIVFV